MPAAWFLSPYKRRTDRPGIVRYCAVDDLSDLVAADDGAWSEAEVLGDHAIVKVRASAATLTAIAALPGVSRLPADRRDQSLSSLSGPQKSALRARVSALGYTADEIAAALPGDLGSHTLGDVLDLIASRRRKVRYDPDADAIVADGPDQPTRPVADLDDEVADTAPARARRGG